jgi:hypothetical protein
MEGKKWLGRRWKRGIYRGPRNMTVGAEKRSDPRPKRYYRLSKRYYRSRANCAENGQKSAQSGTTSGTTARAVLPGRYRVNTGPDALSRRDQTGT